MYLNKWDLSFDPEKYFHSSIPVWVKLPHLPLHCWNDEYLKAIGNTLKKYIDKSEPKPPMFSCARICVEVDLEKGLPEAINLSMNGWNHLQTVDYGKILFKCKTCHEYGHFAKFCPKKIWTEEGESQKEEWNEVHKRKGSKAGPSKASPVKKKPNANKFQALEIVEEEEIVMEEKYIEKKTVEAKKDKPILMEIWQEGNLIPTLP